MNRLRILTLAFLVALVAPAMTGSAGQAPSEAEMVNGLRWPTEGRDYVNLGSMLGGEKSRKPPAINLSVAFAFGSATLLPEARTTLDALGRALNDSALMDQRFLVAGHTDAVGDDAANGRLSRQRADAVKTYLVERHKIAAPRLDTDGLGARELLDVVNPTSAVNRRVEIRNLGR